MNSPLPYFAEPVLLIGFNRPDLLVQVIERLRTAQPRRVYIAIDGPRSGHPDDPWKVQACRDAALTIDWTSDLHLLFHEENLGCGRAVSAALAWFFSCEERGVIIEDDILPAPSFLEFCSTLLDRYAQNPQVGSISGCNLVPDYAMSTPETQYRFSQITHVWGWATWRRAWEHYRFDLSDWRAQLSTETLWRCTGGSLTGTLHWGAAFDAVRRGLIDTWDIQWVFSSMCAGQLTATTNVNLASNQGFEREPTHPVPVAPAQQPVGRIDAPISSVPVRVDTRADAWTLKHHFQAPARAAMAVRSRDPYFAEFVREIRELSSAR